MSSGSSSMQSDHYFVEMLNMMREQGRKDNPTTLQLGVMQSERSVRAGDLLLYAEDLYIADYLVAGYTREAGAPTEDGSNPNPEAPAGAQNKISFSDGLKKGDLVAVQKLQNTNKYVILAKVVRA